PGMVLTYRENDGFANLVCDWVAQCVLQKSLAKNAVRFVREKFLFKIPGNEGFRLFSFLRCKSNCITLIREQLGSDFSAGIQNFWVNQVPIFHPINQRIPESWVATLAPEGGVRIPQHSPLNFS